MNIKIYTVNIYSSRGGCSCLQWGQNRITWRLKKKAHIKISRDQNVCDNFKTSYEHGMVHHLVILIMISKYNRNKGKRPCYRVLIYSVLIS